jgi:hypothetical protein
MSTRTAALLFALIATLPSAQAADTAEKSYALPDHGTLRLIVPRDWKDELHPQQGTTPLTITFQPAQGAPFEVLVTPIWRANADVPVATRETIAQRVRRSAEEIKSQSVETDIPLVEFASASGPGLYYSVTDKAPKPDEFRYLSQGMVKVAELVLTFSVLTNDGQADVVTATLEMMKSAVHVAR